MAWIDNTRIFAIFAVIILHVSGRIVVESDLGSTYWWYGNVYDSLVRWCVPVFVMISGALLLDPGKHESVSTFYKKRVAKILIPIVCWSILYLCWSYTTGILNGHEPSIEKMVRNCFQGTPYYHMWFLYMIIGLYMFTPFLRIIIAHSTMKNLKILIILMFVFSIASSFYAKFIPSSKPLFLNMFLPYLAYFLIGYYIRKDTRLFSKALLCAVFMIATASTVLGCYYISITYGFSNGLYFYDYFSITVVPMSISLMYLLKSWAVPIVNDKVATKTASLVLGIYLVHPLVIAISYHFNVTTNFSPLFSIPIISIYIFVISLLISWAISQVPYLRRTI